VAEPSLRDLMPFAVRCPVPLVAIQRLADQVAILTQEVLADIPDGPMVVSGGLDVMSGVKIFT
jgi:hypothetical protein